MQNQETKAKRACSTRQHKQILNFAVKQGIFIVLRFFQKFTNLLVNPCGIIRANERTNWKIPKIFRSVNWKFFDEFYSLIDEVNASLRLSKLLRFRVAIKSVVSALSTAITFWLSILFSAFRKPGYSCSVPGSQRQYLKIHRRNFEKIPWKFKIKLF